MGTILESSLCRSRADCLATVGITDHRYTDGPSRSIARWEPSAGRRPGSQQAPEGSRGRESRHRLEPEFTKPSSAAIPRCLDTSFRAPLEIVWIQKTLCGSMWESPTTVSRSFPSGGNPSFDSSTPTVRGRWICHAKSSKCVKQDREGDVTSKFETVTGGIFVVLTSILTITAPAGAQESDPGRSRSGDWSLDFRMGYANATGDLGDLSDEGFLGGLGLSYGISPRVALRSDVSVQRLRRAGRPRTLGGILGPRTILWHLLGAAEVELTGPDATPWSVWTVLGAGASFLDVTGTLDGGASVPSQQEWKPTLGLAAKVGYALTRSVEVVGQSEVFLMLGDRTAPEEYLGKEAVIGTSLGLRLSF